MMRETIAQEEWKGYQVSLYKTKSSDGRARFFAEASLEDGDKFLLDHWNLSSLQRMVREVMPVVQMARGLAKPLARALNK
jgi:hypothetical protein